MPRYTPYRNRLRTILSMRRMGYKDLANDMHEPGLHNAIKNWAVNRNQPSEENIRKICGALEIKRTELLYFLED